MFFVYVYHCMTNSIYLSKIGHFEKKFTFVIHSIMYHLLRRNGHCPFVRENMGSKS